MDHNVKKIVLLEKAKNELTSEGHDVTPENLYYFLTGMQEAWTEDNDESEEKSAWMLAVRSLIHDQLHALENA